ncbi:unnamed protein product [Brassica oleracea var. botrytis]
MRHHQRASSGISKLLRWCSLSEMLGLTTFVGGGGGGRRGALGRGSWWLEDFSLCITTHIICLINDKFTDKKKKTPSLRESKAKP